MEESKSIKSKGVTYFNSWDNFFQEWVGDVSLRFTKLKKWANVSTKTGKGYFYIWPDESDKKWLRVEICQNAKCVSCLCSQYVAEYRQYGKSKHKDNDVWYLNVFEEEYTAAALKKMRAGQYVEINDRNVLSSKLLSLRFPINSKLVEFVWISSPELFVTREYVSGTEILLLSETLAQNLGYQEARLVDESKVFADKRGKKQIPLMILQNLRNGISWYESCGYKLLEGTYDSPYVKNPAHYTSHFTTRKDYRNCVQRMRNLPLQAYMNEALAFCEDIENSPDWNLILEESWKEKKTIADAIKKDRFTKESQLACFHFWFLDIPEQILSSKEGLQHCPTIRIWKACVYSLTSLYSFFWCKSFIQKESEEEDEEEEEESLQTLQSVLHIVHSDRSKE